MVLTRLSHVGEVCPLSDHSYSDPIFHSSHEFTSSQHIVPISKSSHASSLVDCGETSFSAASMNLLDFPTEVLEKILSYFTYKQIGELRRVCKRFDKICAHLLNVAFQRLQNQMLSRFQATKSQMPRRESARRKHPLARESDILETLHMRLTLLQMTFGKHIERKYCCFFAGDILDEVYRILRCLKSTSNMGKVFKITDELFDLSVMAMEYFKEHIEPSLPEIGWLGSKFLDITTRFSDSGSNRCSVADCRMSEPEEDVTERDPLPPSNMVLRKRIRKIRQGMRRYNSQLTVMRKELRVLKNKVVDQNKQVVEYFARMEECDKKMDDMTRKLSTVLQELNKCKTEVQYWRSRSPVPHPVCMYCHCGRLAAGENAGPSDGFWPLREPDDKVMGPPQARPLIPSYYSSPSSSPSSSVKNLEPLFDLEKNQHPFFPNQEASKEVQLACSSSNTAFPSTSLSLSDLEEMSDHTEGPQKRSSSDEDTDIDTDTVGRRVRERKRVRLELH